MNRAEATRSQLRTLARATPFRPFAVNLENGDRIIVEHMENIFFDYADDGAIDLVILSNKLFHYSNLTAVSSAVILDRGELPAAASNGRG